MLLVFIIWPLLAFIWSLLNYRTTLAKRIVFAFIVLYGFTFIVNKEYDSDRYVQYFENTLDTNFSSFWYNVTNLYSSEAALDLVRPTITFFVSRVTSNHHFLFAAFAFVFGYFYLGSINSLYQYKNSKLPNINASVFLFYLVILIPISEINGFRFWTASWVFFYGVINYILFSDKRFLLVALSAPLVHFSFLSAIIVLLLYVLLGNRNTIYFILLLLSFVLPELLSQYILVSPAELGEGLETKVTQYSDKDYLILSQTKRSKDVWFISWAHPIVSGFLVFALAWIKIFKNKFLTSIAQNKLFSFTVFFLAFANFMEAMPSGGRFQQVFYLLAVANIILFFLSHKTKKWHFLTMLSIAPFALWFLIKLRVLAVSTDLFLFSPTPILLASPLYSVLEFLQALGIL